MALIDELQKERKKLENEKKSKELQLEQKEQELRKIHYYDDIEVQVACQAILNEVRRFMFHSNKKQTPIRGWVYCNDGYKERMAEGNSDGISLNESSGYIYFKLDDPSYIKEKIIKYIQDEYRIPNPTVTVSSKKVKHKYWSGGLFKKKYYYTENKIYISFFLSK